MIQRGGDVVLVHRSKEDFLELLEEAVGSKLDASDLTQQDEAQFAGLMSELAATEANQEVGGASVVVNNVFFPLKRSIFNVLIITAALAAAAVATASMGGAATPAVAAAVLGAIERVTTLVKTLNPTELAVYEAVQRVMRAREDAKTPPYGASADEVEKYFLGRNEEPPAAAFLTQLANKGVLTSDVDGRVVRYSVVN